MRGGTSKGAYFLAVDLPADDGRARPRAAGGDGLARPAADRRRRRRRPPDQQGGHRVARRRGPASTWTICSARCGSTRPRSRRSRTAATSWLAWRPSPSSAAWWPRATRRPCVRIFMVNTSQTVVATVQTPGGRPRYDGDTAIDGVPGTAAPIPLSFADTAGSTCGALLPTGHAVDVVNGVRDHLHRQRHAGGRDARRATSAAPATRPATRWTSDAELKARIEAIRLIAGPMMNLGDVTAKTVPKMILVSPPARRRCHLHAVVHPAPLPRDDRRLRGAERRHGVPAARRAGARRGRAADGPARGGCSSSTRRAPARCC